MFPRSERVPDLADPWLIRPGNGPEIRMKPGWRDSQIPEEPPPILYKEGLA